MTHRFLLLLALPAAVLAMGADACSGSSKTSCVNNADCEHLTTTPICEEVAGEKICVASTNQCDNDVQCRVTDAGGSAACTASSSCSADDKCVIGAGDDGHCVTPADGCGGAVGQVLVNATDTEGAAVTFCGDTGVSCASNECSGGSFE